MEGTAVHILAGQERPGYEALPRNPLPARLRLPSDRQSRQGSAFPGGTDRPTFMPRFPLHLRHLAVG